MAEFILELESGEPADPQAWRFELAASPSPELVEAMWRAALELQRRFESPDTPV